MQHRLDQPLRVLMTADTVGGVWTYALDLAAALGPCGVEVTLAVFGPAADAAQSAAADRAGAAVVHLGEALDWTAETPEQVRTAALRLAELAQALAPDLLQANSPALLASLNVRAPTLAVCHSDVKTWWAAVRPGQPLPPDLAWRAGVTAVGYAAADALVAPTQVFAEATRTAYGLAAPVEVVWNGRRAVASAGAGASPEAFAFTAGRLWDEAKGLATFDQAVADGAVAAYAAGSLTGPNGATVRPQAVQPLGRLDDAALNAWLDRRPIFVSPSLYEPFGLAVLEAAQAGCPLLLSDIPSFRELWDGAALFTPPGDAPALAAALKGLAKDEGRRIALGRAARERAGRYTLDRFATGMLDVYRRLSARQVQAVA